MTFGWHRAPSFPKPFSRALALTLLASLPQVGLGQDLELPDNVVNNLIEQTQEIFWVNEAASWDDRRDRPAEADPAAPILPLRDAKRVVYYAIPTGLAMWCGVEWRLHYREFMRRERGLELYSETQLAFMGSLFGMTQGFVATTMASKPCTAEQRAQIAEQMP